MSSTATASICEVREGHKAFGAVRALAGVDIQIKAGELLGIVGPNGSGKTTLFNCMSGQLHLNRGQVLLEGHDVTTWPMHRIARSGLVRTFQQSMYFHSASVRQNVEMARSIALSVGLNRAPPPESDTLVEQVGLGPLAQRPSSVLSHGQLRRLGVAIALAAAPVVLLLDEPAAGLSDAEANRLADVLLGVRERGVTVAVVDHDMGFLIPLVDRMVVLSAGRKLADGPPAEVRNSAAVIEAYLGSPHWSRKPVTSESGLDDG